MNFVPFVIGNLIEKISVLFMLTKVTAATLKRFDMLQVFNFTENSEFGRFAFYIVHLIDDCFWTHGTILNTS